jgi:radical SAM protein with 4Fe4S-binding SPASM domain
MKRKKGNMSRELYKKIIDQASDLKIRYINLHNFGEPLVDKDFVWRVKYAKSKKIDRISTNTNGTLLTPKLSQNIIKSGLDELYISVDAATKKTYQKIRIGLNYDQVQKNIIYLAKLKKQLKSDKPKIILDFLEFNLNKNETKKFINKWKKVVDDVCISQIHDWSNKKKINIGKSINNYVEFSQAPCRLPFTEMLINWDGTVSLCCQDIDGEVILGDINKETILNIWQNKKYQEIRKSHLKLKTNNHKLCKDCKLRTFWWTF